MIIDFTNLAKYRDRKFLASVLKLNTTYSKTLYDILTDYKDTGILIISVNRLKDILGLIDLSTGKEKYPDFNLFASKVLDVAQKEMSEKTDINFTYTPNKIGKEVTDIEFRIRGHLKVSFIKPTG